MKEMLYRERPEWTTSWAPYSWGSDSTALKLERFGGLGSPGPGLHVTSVAAGGLREEQRSLHSLIEVLDQGSATCPQHFVMGRGTYSGMM